MTATPLGTKPTARAFLARIPRLRRVPPREIPTTLRVAVLIVIVEVLVRTVPLPRLSRLLGVPLDLRPHVGSVEPLPLASLPDRARRRLRCTRRVADVWPFSHGPCLRRALIGGHLVRELQPSVRLGITATGDELLAHAWLEIGGRPLESVEHFQRFEQVVR